MSGKDGKKVLNPIDSFLDFCIMRKVKRDTEMENFKFVGSGIWRNEIDNVSVMEDYRKTFRAYAWYRPNHHHVMLNAAGNPIRFRSREAAMRHALASKRRREKMTMKELAIQLERQPTVNEWRIANGQEPWRIG